MKESCDIVKDLCILVKEESSSNASKEFVEKHINECEECKNYYDSIEEEITLSNDEFKIDDRDTKEIFSYSKRVKKHICKVGLCIGGLIIGYAILVAVILFGGMFYSDLSKNTYSTTDINNYRVFNSIEGEEELNRVLKTFPEGIKNPIDVSKYYYYCNNGLLDNTYEMYLEQNYSQEDFEKEEARLSVVNDIKKVKYNDNDFMYPAYVAIYGDDSTYEYALLDEDNNKIIYIYTRLINEDKIQFNKEYLPKGFMKEENMQSNYSIYIN